MLLKQYEIVSRTEFFKEPVEDTLKRYKTIKQWAYVVHDRDEGASPHIHVYVNFGNSSVDSKTVAGWFGLQESCVCKVHGQKSDMLLYLTHGNESQKNKYRYNPENVHANFDLELDIKNSLILGDFDNYSYAEQLAYVNTIPVSEKSKAFTKLEKLWKLHCLCESMKTGRNIDVVFICGKGGSGKTFYAKKLLEKLNYDYCISSSENDAFQDYLGQRAIILDDLRDSAFVFPDLLKILDNNTSSSVKSRFSNRVFSGKMIVITSSIPVWFWYRNGENKVASEDLYQLYRRIGSYMEVKETSVCVYNDGLDNFGKPKGSPKVYKNEVYDLKRANGENKFVLSSVFDEISEKAEEVITTKQRSLTELFEKDDSLPF